MTHEDTTRRRLIRRRDAVSAAHLAEGRCQMRMHEGYRNGTLRARETDKERVKPVNTVDIPMLNNEPEIHANWDQPLLRGGSRAHLPQKEWLRLQQ